MQQPPLWVPIDTEIQRIKLELEQWGLQLKEVNTRMASIRSHYQQSNFHGYKMRSNRDAALRKLQPVKEGLQGGMLAREQYLTHLKMLKAQGKTYVSSVTHFANPLAKAPQQPQVLPYKTKDQLFEEGYQHNQAGQYHKAIEAYTQAIVLDRNYAEAYNNRGIVYRNLKEYEQATVDFYQAIALKPKYTIAYYNRGKNFNDLKQYEKAFADFDRAIALDRNFAAAYNNRSLLYEWLGQRKQKAFSSTPVDPRWEIKDKSDEGLMSDDELLVLAEEITRNEGHASISLLQRRLRIGYSRAARLINLLEERSIIGPSEQRGRSREVFNNRDSSSSLGDAIGLADEIADIAAEEQARNEFLRNQTERKSSSQ